MRGPTVENLCCRVEALEATSAELVTDVAAIEAVYNVETVYGAGTADALAVDGTQVAIDLGTTDPVITLGEAGRYLILAQVKLEYTGATITTQTVSFKLRRTNNTAADVADSGVLIDLPAATTLTHTYGVINLPPVEYVTSNADDAISIFGAVSAATGAGTIDVSAASIVAIRLA